MATTRAATAAGMRFPFSGLPPILASGFGPELAAVSAARLVVRDALMMRQVCADTTQDMLLIVSELVTNAIQHAPGPYELRIYAGTGLLGCEVTDRDPRPFPFPLGNIAQPEPDLPATQALPECGRGLALVTALTLGNCGWHATPDHPGKSVWCLLDHA